MNVLLYYPNVNFSYNIASTIHTRNIVNKLANTNKNYTLVASNIDDNLSKKIKCVNISVPINLPFLTTIQEIYALIYMIISRYVNNNKFDIIYQRETIIASGILLKLAYKSKLITEFNGIASEEKAYVPLVLRIFNKVQIFQSDVIVTVSDDIKSRIKEILGEKYVHIEVIENGVDIDLFKPMDMTKCQKELNLNCEYEYICYVGSLELWQRVDDLIECAARLKSQLPNLRFIIIGDGSDMSYLKSISENKRVGENIIFTGRVDHTIIVKYINSCRICIATYAKGRKASPLKLLEYLACEKIVITQDISFIRNYDLEKYVNLVDTTNPNLFSELIYNILESKQPQKNHISNETRSRFSWDTTAFKIEKLLEKYGTN